MSSRSKKALAEEAENFHKEILDYLELNKDVAITQIEYKGDLFKIFRKAYQSGFCGPLRYNRYVDTGRVVWITKRPLVSDDSIWDYALEKGWVHAEMSGDEQRYKDIHLVMTWWDAWSYAWRQLGHKTGCYRYIEKDPSGDFLRSQSTKNG